MPEPQSRTEFRTVWYAGGVEFSGPNRDDLGWAESDRTRKEDEHGGEYRHMVAIQKRTVSETPWEDVQDGE